MVQTFNLGHLSTAALLKVKCEGHSVRTCAGSENGSIFYIRVPAIQRRVSATGKTFKKVKRARL